MSFVRHPGFTDRELRALKGGEQMDSAFCGDLGWEDDDNLRVVRGRIVDRSARAEELCRQAATEDREEDLRQVLVAELSKDERGGRRASRFWLTVPFGEAPGVTIRIEPDGRCIEDATGRVIHRLGKQV